MKLFEPVTMKRLQLKNRVVMAPMTRSRAIGNMATDLIAQYYSQRAGAGLIITEGISPSPNGLGYARIPGLFTAEQAESWRQVTKGVHDRGAKFFAQLMHTGRASHPANLPKGARVVAPSSIPLSGKIWTDSEGEQPYPVPQEMSLADIKSTIGEYARAGELAIAAGFDGIELHGANGYLLDQFLNPKANKRTDAYGATAEGRMRFVLETAQAAVDKIGGDRVGIRVSPYGVFNDTGAFEGIDQFYAELSRRLSAIGLVHIHVVDHSTMGAPPVSADVKRLIRENFKGTYILSGGYDRDRAEKDLAEGKGDLVAFGRPFIANPDLVEKLRDGRTLTQPDKSLFYTPGREGYTDY